MKMSIKEMKERGEKDDKVKFLAKVRNVYDAKDLTPEQKAKAKYTVSRQNVIVEDDTDKIQIIISHKKKEFEYTQDTIGKEVEVDGKLSLWEGKVNIFGKLTFKEGEEPLESPKGIQSGMSETLSVIPSMPIGIKVRTSALENAIDFWGSRIGHEMEEKEILKTADIFKKYITGDSKVKEAPKQEKKEKKEEPKELEGTKSDEQVIKIDNVPLINEIMQLKEDHHLDAETFAVHCDKKDIKTLSTEELLALKTKLKNLTEEIPF